MAQSVQHLYLLLLSMVSMQLAFGMPMERSERALGSDGVAGTEKGAVHRQRLALYNLLESPGYNQDLERQTISRYIPLGLGNRQQAVAQPSKEIPFAPQVYSSTSGLVVPTNSNQAPYASAQFIQPLDYQQFYPYQPLAVYAPAYPYVYKTVVPEEVP